MNFKTVFCLLILISLASAFTQFPCDSHTKTYLKLDETSGTDLIDACAGGAFGSTGNNGTRGSGEFGQPLSGTGSIEFDGAATNAELTNKTSVDTYDALTMDVLFNTTDNSTYGFIATTGSNNFVMFFSDSAIMSGEWRIGSTVESVSSHHIAENIQYHFALQYNGSHVSLWEEIDGVMVEAATPNAATGATTPLNPTSVFCLGSYTTDRSDCNANYFTGTIDEVRISTVTRYGNGAVVAGATTVCEYSANSTISEDTTCVDNFEVTAGANVTADGVSVTLTNLTVSDTSSLVITNSYFNVTGDLFQDGELIVDPTVVEIAGDYYCDGVVTYTDSIVSISGDLYVEPDCNYSLYNSTLTVGGELNITGGVFHAGNITVHATTMEVGSGGLFNGSEATSTIDDYVYIRSAGNVSVGSGFLNVTNRLEMWSGGKFNGDTGITKIGESYTGSDYALDIANAATFKGGSGPMYIGTIYVVPEITLTSGTTYFTSARAASITLAFVSSAVDANGGTVQMSSSGNQFIYADNAMTFYDLLVNKTGGTFQHYGGNGNDITVDNDLIVEDGTFNTWDSVTSHPLTVSGDVRIDSGATLGGQASTISFKSLDINGGTYSATSGTTTLTGETAGGLTLDCDGTFTHNGGEVVVTNPSSHSLDLQCGSGNLYDLHINANTNAQLDPNPDAILGDLTLSQASLLYLASGSYTLDVSGNVTLENTARLLDGSDTSAVSFGSLTIGSGTEYDATSGTTTITSETAGGYAYDCDGTFTDNTGTVTFTTAAHTKADVACNGNLYNVIVNMAGGSDNFNFDGNSVIDNDLTVSDGNVITVGYNDALTVTGDVLISSGGNLGTVSVESGAFSFGSLTIASGGAFGATSGTTTITSETVGGGEAVNCDGTFTHNNGLLLLASTTTSKADLACSGNPYDVVIDLGGSAVNFGFNEPTTIDNDFNVTDEDFFMNTDGDALTVVGDVIVASGSKFGDGTETGSWSFGSFTVLSGGDFEATSGLTTITSESVVSGKCIDIDSGSTFSHNNGLIVVKTPALTEIEVDPAQSLFGLDIDSASFTVEFDDLTLDGDLNVTDGVFSPVDGSDTLTVVGDVLVKSGGTLSADGGSQAFSFDSLDIDGGVYSATSGITTIVGEAGDGNAFNCDGTFTHNDGRLNFTNAVQTSSDWVCSGNPYDVNVEGVQTFQVGTALTVEHDLYVDIPTNRYFFVHPDGNAFSVVGDVEVVSGYFGDDSEDGPWSFGGLTVQSSAVFGSTAGTLVVEDGVVDIFGTYNSNGGVSRWLNVSGDNLNVSGTGSVLNDTKLDVSTYDHLMNALPLQLVKGIVSVSDEDNGLVGFWKFDDSAYSGTTPDSSGLGNDGTFENCDVNCYNGQGWSNSALELDGVSQYVNLTNAFSESSFTIEVWVKTTVSAVDMIYDTRDANDDGIGLILESTGVVRLVRNSDDITSTSKVDDGEWHLISATSDGTTSSLYIDGKLEITGASSSAISTTTVPKLGVVSYTDTAYYEGLIDEVRFYDRVLSAAEISSHYGLKGTSGVGGTFVANVTKSFYNSTDWVNRSSFSLIASNSSWSYTNETTAVFDTGEKSVEFMINTTGAGFGIGVLNDTGGNALLNSTLLSRANGTFVFTGTTYHPTNFYSLLNITNSSGSLLFTNTSINVPATFSWSSSYNFSEHAPDNFTYELHVGSSHTHEKIKAAESVTYDESGDLKNINFFNFYGKDLVFSFDDPEGILEEYEVELGEDRYKQNGKFAEHVCVDGVCEYNLEWYYDGGWTVVEDSPYPGHAVGGDFGSDDVVWVDTVFDVPQATYYTSVSPDKKTLFIRMETPVPIEEFEVNSLGLINRDNVSWSLGFGGLAAGGAVNTTVLTLDLETFIGESVSSTFSVWGDTADCSWNSSVDYVSFDPQSVGLNETMQNVTVTFSPVTTNGIAGNAIWLNCSDTNGYVWVDLVVKDTPTVNDPTPPTPGPGGGPGVVVPTPGQDLSISGKYLTVKPGTLDAFVPRDGEASYDVYVTSTFAQAHTISVESSVPWITFERFSKDLSGPGRAVFRFTVRGASEAGTEEGHIKFFVNENEVVESRVNRLTGQTRMISGFLSFAYFDDFMGSELFPGVSGALVAVVILVLLGSHFYDDRKTKHFVYYIGLVVALIWWMWGHLIL